MLLSQFAAAAPAMGIQFSVAHLRAGDGDPAAAPLEAAGITPLNLHAQRGRPGIRTLHRVRRYVASIMPDIVHTHLENSDWIGALAAGSLGIPTVSTVHTASWGEDRRTSAKRMVVKVCDARVVAVSDSARRAYGERHWARGNQLIVIRNGVDLSPVPGAGRTVRRSLNWSEDDLVVGMISSLRPEKAHDVAIAAIRRLQGEFPSLRLLIAGEGPTENVVARLARDLGQRVVMTGLRSDVMDCLDACDVCLHPSRADAFPTTLIEAMAASVPVLATSVGGIPELIADGETGVLIPAPPRAEMVANALAELLRDRSRRRALASAARSSYEEHFTAGRWLRETRAMYDSVLAESGARMRRGGVAGAWRSALRGEHGDG